MSGCINCKGWRPSDQEFSLFHPVVVIVVWHARQIIRAVAGGLRRTCIRSKVKSRRFMLSDNTSLKHTHTYLRTKRKHIVIL